MNDLEWLYGRDGSLTARDSNGCWWSGCSLPRRAAIAQLKRFHQAQGTVACFLAPPHAAAVRVALDKLRPEQALIAIVPDERDMHVMLACEDFSQDFDSHRLWFASGDAWADELTRLFGRESGLPLPTQFVRLNTADPESTDKLIATAQRVFSDTTARRADAIRAFRDSPRENRERICVVAPSLFRLWNDWGATLRVTFADDPSVSFLDTDDPTCASPLAIARAAAECDAIVTIDAGRSDLPNVVADSIRWVTWSVSGRIPAATRGDLLVLLDTSDRAAATAAGWTDEEICVAEQGRVPVSKSTGAQSILIVADTLSLEPPASIDEFSSHRLLWDYVSDELSRNPFAMGHDIDAYLTSRLRKFEVDEQTLSRAAFTSRLIVPAFMQGITRLMIERGIDVRIYGSGWDSDARFAQRWSGPVESREQLAEIVDQTGTLVHVWPDRRVHPIDFIGRSIVRAFDFRSPDALLNQLRRNEPCAKAHIAQPLSPRWLRSILWPK